MSSVFSMCGWGGGGGVFIFPIPKFLCSVLWIVVSLLVILFMDVVCLSCFNLRLLCTQFKLFFLVWCQCYKLSTKRKMDLNLCLEETILWQWIIVFACGLCLSSNQCLLILFHQHQQHFNTDIKKINFITCKYQNRLPW